jgi:hypothetical protein
MMKLRILVVGVVALAVSASSAIAVPPPGKGKPDTAGKPETAGKPLPTGPSCKPKVTVVLKGEVTSASAGSLGMDVTRSNRWGRAWVTAGTATVTLNADTTKVRRNGKKLATDLLVGDRVLVQARVCKADLDDATPPALTAVRVVAHPAKA